MATIQTSFPRNDRDLMIHVAGHIWTFDLLPIMSVNRENFDTEALLK